jgi:hypothetical protein
LAEQLQSVLEPENVMNPIAEEGRINWRAIQTSAQAILEQKTS